MKDVLRYASMRSGGLSVITTGMKAMLSLPVYSLASLLTVRVM